MIGSRGRPTRRLLIAVILLIGACVAGVPAPSASASVGAAAPFLTPKGGGAPTDATMDASLDAPMDAPMDAKVTNLGLGLSGPAGITTGPDGNLWFVERGTVYGTSWWLSRVTPSGVITHFTEIGFKPGGGLVSGPDGNLWFGGEGAVAKMTTAGTVTTFPDAAIGFVSAITVGPDGALWFADNRNDQLGRVTTSGDVTTFAAGDIDAPIAIVTGPDGNLWFGSTTTPRIGRMSPTGATTSYPLAGDGKAASMVVGPDGAIWVTGSGRTGSVTMAGVSTLVPSFTTLAGRIVLGSDGNLWLSLSLDAKMARLTPAGVVTYFDRSGRDQYEDVTGLAPGPDGALWYTLSSNSFGTMTMSGQSSSYHGTLVDRPDDVMPAPDGTLLFTNTSTSFGRISTDGGVPRVGPSVFPLLYLVLHSAIDSEGDVWYVSGGSLAKMSAADGTVVASTRPPDAQNSTGLTIGPDGDLWYSASWYWSPYDMNNRPTEHLIVRVTPQGAAQVFHHALLVGPKQITMGPDGNLWFVNNTKEIGRMSPTGAMASFAPAGVTSIEHLAAGPDGNMWFTTGTGSTIGRVTPAGVTTVFPTGSLTPQAITPGPDGNLWFTSWPHDAIGRITPDGIVSGITDTTVDHATSIAAGGDGALYFTNQGNNSIGQVVLAPPAPTGVVGEGGTTAVKVSWTPPSATGGAPIAGYETTATPGGSSCATTALTCTVRGLTPGVAYTFTVTASNAVGPGAVSAPSAPVTPGRGGAYHPLTPARALDSRTATGSWSGPLAAGAPRDLQITGVGDVPDGAAAVVMNVTATASDRNSFVTVFPAGEAPPTSSNLNFGVGETIPNLVTVKVGASGKVSFANAAGAVHLVADVVGYYDDGIGAGDLFTGIAPTRLLDSRGDTGGWGAPLVAGTPRDLVVRPGAGATVPASATAVAVNVTATGASEGSFLSVWPSGGAAPGVSNLNFGAGQTIPNLAVVKIGEGGSIRLANAVGAVDVVVDVVGYFDPTAGARFHAVTPTRVLDDRVGTGLAGPWGAAQSRTLPVAGEPGTNVASGASGLVVNVTATGATVGSFVTVYPDGVTRPGSSSLNFGAGQTIPNLVMTGLGPGGVAFWNAAGSVDLIADVVGYYAAT